LLVRFKFSSMVFSVNLIASWPLSFENIYLGPIHKMGSTEEYYRVATISKVKLESNGALCSICSKFGAVVSCWFLQCGKVYYLPCAEAAGLIEWHHFHSHADLSDFASESIWHDSDMCDMTHRYVWYDSWICLPWHSFWLVSTLHNTLQLIATHCNALLLHPSLLSSLTSFVHCPIRRDPLCEIYWAGDETHTDPAFFFFFVCREREREPHHEDR